MVENILFHEEGKIFELKKKCFRKQNVLAQKKSWKKIVLHIRKNVLRKKVRVPLRVCKKITRNSIYIFSDTDCVFCLVSITFLAVNAHAAAVLFLNARRSDWKSRSYTVAIASIFESFF